MPKKIIPAKITARWLKSIGACKEAVADFRRTFPNGIGRAMAAHVKRARQALGAGSLNWLCAKLRGDSHWRTCSTCARDAVAAGCFCRGDDRAVAAQLRKLQRAPRA